MVKINLIDSDHFFYSRYFQLLFLSKIIFWGQCLLFAVIGMDESSVFRRGLFIIDAYAQI